MEALPVFSPLTLKARLTSLTLLVALLLSFASPVTFAALDDDDEDDGETCTASESIKRRIETKNDAISRGGSQNLVDGLKRDLVRLEDDLAKAENACAARRKSKDRAFAKCQKKMNKAGNEGLYRWNAEKNECVDVATDSQKANPNSGECNNAEIAKGTNLRGENCKTAVQAVKDISARQEALGQAGLVATQAYSGFQAQQATGAQQDAQARQTKILQALAAMKIATGVVALSGAATLKAAANGAEEASTNISGAHKELYDYCYQPAMVSKMTPEQCFYQNAQKKGIPADAKSYATFERLKSGADQSQEAADKANALAKTALVQGAAETAVGLQALYMSRQTQQTAANFAPPPVVAGTVFNPGSMSANSGGGGIGTPLAPGTDDGGAGDGISLGGSDGGQLKGGLMGGRTGGYNTYKPEKSGVSGGGGGGGTGGGRGGGGGQSRKGGGKGNTTAGEYQNSGAGTMGSKGGGAAGGKDAAGNPLADIMNKLFPPNADGKPVVDARDVASNGEPTMEEEGQSGGVEVSELSIFEQVNSRYRVLNGKGQI